MAETGTQATLGPERDLLPRQGPAFWGFGLLGMGVVRESLPYEKWVTSLSMWVLVSDEGQIREVVCVQAWEPRGVKPESRDTEATL